MRAVVTGMVATYPIGGVVWDYLQYALGLERLGWDVFYLEDTGGATYDPTTGVYGDDCHYAVRFLERSLQELSPQLRTRWHFRSSSGETYGLSASAMADLVAGCDLFLNVSGSCLLREMYLPCRRKALIDTDPGYNHFVNYPRQEAGQLWPGTQSFRAHDWFFTYAERIGAADCLLPDFGLPWQPTRPPVVLDCWQSQPPGRTWTTVMTWDNFRRPIEHNGCVYGTKEREFGRIEQLPRVALVPLEVAVGGASPPVEKWQSLGWSVLDSHGVSRTADEYRTYIEGSRGEFSVAKNVYVATRCGWFSCRSVCYLAAGRPVVVQDTGFSQVLPTGEGVLIFADLETAAAAIAAVEADYAHHQRAAREAARQHFSHEVVLRDLLARVGLE
jgi:glycosyl transferase family 1